MMHLPPRATRAARSARAVTVRAARWTRDFTVRRSMPLIAALGVLAAALAAGTGWLLWQQGQQSAVAAAREEAMAAAKTGVTDVLSYSYGSFNADEAKATAALTGQFRQEYTQLMTKVVASAAKRQKAQTNADVVSAAVTSATQSTARLLLFVDQSTVSSSFTGPKLDGSRVVVTLDKVGGKWLISGIKPV